MTENIDSLKHFMVPTMFFAVALGVLIAALIVREYIAGKTAQVLSDLAKTAGAEWDDKILTSIKRPVSFLILISGAWLAVKILRVVEKPPAMERIVDIAAQISVILLFAWLFLRMIKIFVSDLQKKTRDPEYRLDPHLIPVISIVLKSLLLVGVFIVIAQTLGYSVSAIVASLGLGGVAVAFGAKDVLANFFASVAVMADKPFKLGDWIKGPGFEGIVEEIGFRSTRVRTDEKTLMVVPNDKMASLLVENMDNRKDKGLNIRRVNFILGLEYKTGADMLERALFSLRMLLKSHPKVSYLALTVNFYDFGESSLNIHVSYFVKATENEEYYRLREEINFLMMRKMEELGLPLSPRVQTVRLTKED